MIGDTTFVADLLRELRRGTSGPAQRLLAKYRARTIRLTIISAGEIAVAFESSAEAWEWLAPWTIYRLHPGIVDAASDLDRELIERGQRLGENDNWIAGFARYYREPLISRDAAFARAPGLKLISY